MKKNNLYKHLTSSLLFFLIISLTALILSSCKKDNDMNNSSMMDNSKKNNSMDSMQNDMNKNTDKQMNKITDDKMNNMINNMNKMKMSGNTDVDFVNMMIIHHEGAIDMAAAEVSSGKDVNIKSMANNIIKDQQKEIATMQNWLETNKNKKSSSGDAGMKLMESMNVMKNPDMKMTGDADKDFVSMMILHHQGAIEMAGVEINNGTDQEIKMMAQEILKKQKAEVDQMKEWQNSKTK
jgi:uncharacterized protein (DUF305 family)